MDAYLFITDLPGDSVSSGFEEHFEVLGFSSGVDLALDDSRSMKGRRTGGHCTHTPMNIVKRVDKSSPQMLEMCCSGQMRTEAILKLAQATGAESSSEAADKQVFMTFHMRGVNISNVSISGGGGDVTESINISYDTIEWIWDSEAGKTTGCWNQVTNKASLEMPA